MGEDHKLRMLQLYKLKMKSLKKLGITKIMIFNKNFGIGDYDKCESKTLKKKTIKKQIFT